MLPEPARSRRHVVPDATPDWRSCAACRGRVTGVSPRKGCRRNGRCQAPVTVRVGPPIHAAGARARSPHPTRDVLRPRGAPDRGRSLRVVRAEWPGPDSPSQAPGPLRPARGRAPGPRDAPSDPDQPEEHRHHRQERQQEAHDRAGGRRRACRPSQPAASPARKPCRLGRVRLLIGAFATSTVSVDSATWSLQRGQPAGQRVEVGLAAGQLRLDRDDVADRARLREQRPHPVDAGVLARDPGVEVDDVLGGVDDLRVRLVTWPRPAIESISWSSRSAGTRHGQLGARVGRRLLRHLPAAPTAAARTRRVAATGSSASTESCAVRTSDRATPPIGTEPGSACAGARPVGAPRRRPAAAPPPLSGAGRRRGLTGGRPVVGDPLAVRRAPMTPDQRRAPPPATARRARPVARRAAAAVSVT